MKRKNLKHIYIMYPYVRGTQSFPVILRASSIFVPLSKTSAWFVRGGTLISVSIIKRFAK